MKKNLPSSFLLSVILAILLCSSLDAQVTLQQKIGQMIMVGFYGDNETGIPKLPDSLIADLSQRNVGGVICFSYNLTSKGQIQQLTRELQQTAETPLFIATDQEGGIVARLNQYNGFSSTNTAFELGSVYNSLDSTRAEASMMAGWLKECGINIDFAPVADVNVNPKSPAIGHYQRSFSGNPLTVAGHDSVFIAEMHKKNIITSLKHFPGHGSAKTDSHLGFTDITNTWADSELVPYNKLIAGGYDGMVMIGHLFNRNIDSLYPASLSYNAVTKLLRDQIGFNGVVISDELFMDAISSNYSFPEAIKLVVNSGTDIMLFKMNIVNNRSLVDSVVNIVTKAIADGEIPESRIDESYNRIMGMKSEYLNPTFVDNNNRNKTAPSNYSLTNFPNPFNPSTNIVINLSKSSDVSLKIYNAAGQTVGELMNKRLPAGSFVYRFNAGNLASGIYFAVLRTQTNIVTRKIVLLK